MNGEGNGSRDRDTTMMFDAPGHTPKPDGFIYVESTGYEFYETSGKVHGLGREG